MSLENLLAHDAPLLSPTDYNYSLPRTPSHSVPVALRASVARPSPAAVHLHQPRGLQALSQPSPSQPTKKRAAGERISSKDFIPPDVWGSASRKREEFELMEVRVAELEQENARLLAMSTKTEPNDAPISDIEKLPTTLSSHRESSFAPSCTLPKNGNAS
ncbi:hypothetical protein B0H14DRAFT_3515330 [Mycena olivaceomarginata]|nr:hypothetical protein B0H14DRAFT_3515330 [Mycena olivaceomarginata]